MFGYIVIHEPELRVRELALYRSYYCGLCKELYGRYGRAGQLALSYDTTFLALLLTSLYEPSEEKVRESNCLVHPLRRHTSRRNAYTAYAADVTVLLSFYACRDDWEDERRLRGLVLSGLLHSGFERAAGLFPEKAQVIADCLDRLHALETSPPDIAVSPDEAGACFGDLMAEIFAFRQDEWEQPLRRMGYYLGKFIYLLDAYDDLEKDAPAGNFNPLLSVRARMPSAGFDDYVRTLLTMLMASCCRAFEALPIVENIDILRNILYAGVWTRFEQVYADRTGTDLPAAGERKTTYV
ncbi:MAG: hypothetical protein E7237_01755 [Sarcina sp.]|nr:hypothetical protein [Sarcina sp.]